jgi:hypothetical protein
MKYEVRPIREVCYVDGEAVAPSERCFEDAEEKEAHVFCVYVRDTDGCLEWIADFGNRATAERWAKVMEKEDWP